ncbi:NADP-dependent oxidoreductase domain-containing protein [Lenzites betulinus]|nr:NADP-dependent oxidoreductase domain-containing protein [Lenzites betulinus]
MRSLRLHNLTDVFEVIAVCAELDIAIAAYSPLAHGVTSGGVKQPQDVPSTIFTYFDHSIPGLAQRGSCTRCLPSHDPFKGRETWEYTRRFKDAFVELAGQKGCTPAQLSIAWVGTLGEKVIPMPGSSRKDRTLENLHGGDVELSSLDVADVARVMMENPVPGDRGYGAEIDLKLWG